MPVFRLRNKSSPAGEHTLGHPLEVAVAFFWARMGRRVTALARNPVTGQRPPQGAAMTDRSYEIPQDADLRKLARVVSACTLGLWAFAAGLLIGVFLFSGSPTRAHRPAEFFCAKISAPRPPPVIGRPGPRRHLRNPPPECPPLILHLGHMS